MTTRYLFVRAEHATVHYALCKHASTIVLVFLAREYLQYDESPRKRTGFVDAVMTEDCSTYWLGLTCRLHCTTEPNILSTL